MSEPPLPGLDDVPTPAERVFIRLAEGWREGLATVARDSAPPRVVDELALAALLLAREHGATFTDAAGQQTQANIALAETRHMPWVERLPWRLATAARLKEPNQSSELEELVCNLNHHNSAIRVWMMKLAWMVRPWLSPDTALPPLLENVAGTLAGVDMAWGLAGALFDSKELFHTSADSWRPEEFVDQYARRVALLKNPVLRTAQAELWKMEAVCRRLIADEAMNVAETLPQSLSNRRSERAIAANSRAFTPKSARAEGATLKAAEVSDFHYLHSFINLNQEYYDDNPERARVSAVQGLLFPQSPRAVCDEIGLNWLAALKLNGDGWLSFNPETTLLLDESTDAELRFIGSLVRAGCDAGLLGQLVAGLPKPFCYRSSRIYYDWSARRWRMLPEPEPVPETVLSDWLETLVANGDVDGLEALKDQVIEALESVRLPSKTH